MISYDSHSLKPLKHEIFSFFVHSKFIKEMKSQDLRKTVMRMTDDGLSSRQIAQQLRNVVTKSTVQRWQALYRKMNKIDLEKPPGRPKDVRTKNVIRKVKERLKRKPRQSARKLAKRLDISERSMNRIIKDDLHLHAYHVTIEPKLSDLHKKQRLSFAYWVRKNLRIEDHRKILFSDEKYFSMDGIYNRQNDRVYAASRDEADEHGGTMQRSKFPKHIMVWLGASRNGLTGSIIFEPGQTLAHENYIDVVLPHALSEGRRLIGDGFIYQQDNATPHTHSKTQAWCANNFPRFINKEKWPANSPDLNVLDYYVWDAIGNNMNWKHVHNYETLRQEIKKGIANISRDDLVRSIENWSTRILSIIKTKGDYIK